MEKKYYLNKMPNVLRFNLILISLSMAVLHLSGNVEASSADPAKTEEFGSALEELSNRYVLQYGEGCDVQDEVKLRELSVKIDAATDPEGEFRDLGDEISADIKALLNSTFCDGSKALQCQLPGNCGCIREETPEIKVFAEQVEPGKCRLSKGSPCYSEKFRGGQDSGILCKPGTKCLLTSDKTSECNNPVGASKNEEQPCECV